MIKRSSRGFTLLEIVIVLVVASVIIGGAVGAMVFSSDERALRNASGEIELLAKRARTTAILLQTPYALEFRENQVSLLPLAEAGMIQRRTLSGRRVGGEETKPASQAERWQYPIENGIQLQIRRWNDSEWLGAEGDSCIVWRFDPSGLCEPLSVRLAINDSWIEDTYHPLTASIRDSQMEAR